MNREQFMSLLKNPEIPDSKVSGQLHDVLMNYPYCQSARLLYVKSLADQHSILYNDQLKIASAYAIDRTRLYELMNQPVEHKNASSTEDLIADDTTVNAEQKESSEMDRESDSIQNSDGLASQELEKQKSEAKVDIATVNKNDEIIIEEDLEQKEELVHPEEKENPTTIDVTTEHIESKEQIELPVKPKQADLSPHEIIRQRLEELNKVEKEIKVDEKKISELSPALQTKKIKDIEPIVKPESDIHSETLRSKDTQEESIPVAPELIESTLVEEEHLEIAKEEDVKGLEQSKDDFAAENSIVESSFTQNVKFNYESETEKTELPEEKSDLKALDISDEKTNEAELIVNEKGNQSFLSWLKAVDTDSIVEVGNVEPIKEDETEIAELEKLKAGNSPEKIVFYDEPESTSELINRFIEQDPKIEPGKAQFYSAGNMAKTSIVDDGSLASETLASIYLEQGNHQKAIKMLELLSLKNPKKSAYFANRIKEIKNSKR